MKIENDFDYSETDINGLFNLQIINDYHSFNYVMNKDFLNFISRFWNLFKNLSLIRSLRKKLPKTYKRVAPILSPNITIKVPNHFPKINPPSIATGDPNPKNGKTHNIVNNKKIIEIKNKFEFLSSKK